MKRFLCIGFVFVLVVSLFSSCGAKKEVAVEAKDVITLRLAEIHLEGYPTSLADQEFARLVEEKTQGRVKVEVFTGGILYDNEPAAIEALQKGDLAFTRVSTGPLASYVPELNAIQLPYLYKNAQHMWNVLNSPVGQTMLEKIEKSDSGVIGLCYYDGGARSFYLTKEVHCVQDMAGLKIRVQNNPLPVRMCELLGAVGVTGIGTGDVANAIATGAVDGAENNWPTYENMGDYKVAKYYVLDQHTRVPEILLASSVAMNALSAEDAKAIRDLSRQTQEFEIQKWAEKEAQSEQIVRAAGNTVINLTPEAYEEFQQKMEPLYQEFGAGFQDIIAAIKATN